MKINETNYIAELRKHNEKALIYVIDRYSGLLNSIIAKHLHSLQDYREECLNDVFLSIWNNIDYYNADKSSFSNWIAGIARYKSIDYLRKYLKEQDFDDIDSVTISTEDTTAAGLLSRELSEEIQMMLSCLKPKDRELFQKLFYEGKNMAEIAEETGQKKSLLYNRLSRARKQLRQKYVSEKGV